MEVRRVGAGRPELWVVAGVHGDEVEGIACVDEALATLRPRTGSLVGVAVAHPAAFQLGTRRGVDDVDLNRSYPGDPAGGPTERVAHELWSALDGAADALLTIHSWHRQGATAPYVEHARGDARGRELAHSLGLPFAEPWDWPDGLLPKVAVHAGIVAVELELGGLGAQTQASLALGVSAVRAAAAWLGMVDAVPVAATRTVRRRTLRCTSAGRVRQLCALGDELRAGQPVAEVRTLAGDVVERVASPVDGWLAMHLGFGPVAAGSGLANVFELLS